MSLQNTIQMTIALSAIFFNNAIFSMNFAKYYEKKHHIRTSPSLFKTATPSQKTTIEAIHARWDTPKNIAKCNELFQKSLSLADNENIIFDHIPLEDYLYDKEISKLQIKRLQVFRKLPVNDAEKVITDQLKALENHLRNNIARAREELRNAFGVEGDSLAWKETLSLEQKEQDFFLQSMKNQGPNKNIKNKNISPQWVEYVSQAMNLDGFEISTINLSLINDDQHSFASSFVPRQIMSSNGQYTFIPATIGLQEKQNSRLEAHKNNSPIARCFKHAAFHEATHTIKRHAMTDIYTIHGIANALKKSIRVLKDKILKHPLYFKLCLAEEREADVYYATKSQEAAECGMMCAYVPSAGGILYQGSHALLATAKLNWDALKEVHSKKQ